MENKNDFKEKSTSAVKTENRIIKSYFGDILFGFIMANKGLQLFQLETFLNITDSFFDKSDDLVSIKNFEILGVAIIMVRSYDICSVFLDKFGKVSQGRSS